MALLVDASVFITLERWGRPPRALIAAVADEPVALASVTASELLAGVLMADTPARRQRREAFVEALLAVVPILPFDLQVARVHARLWTDLAVAGHLIGAHDLIIAATALTHDAALLTQNVREFERVPGLDVRQPAW